SGSRDRAWLDRVMRCALTGATGFVGGALARQLRSRGDEVVALVRDPGRATYLSELGVQLVTGDLADLDSLDRLCAQADALFHVAGWYKVGQRDPSVGTRVNVDGTRNVLTAARRAGVPRTVYTSTLAVNSDTRGAVHDETYRHHGPYVSQYDRTKAEAHAVAEQFAAAGLPLVIAQPGLVYGPGDTSQTGHLVAQVVRGGRPQVPSGGLVCWAHVDDVAAGHVLALERGRDGEAYMLAGPALSLAEGLRLVASIAGTPGPIVVPTALVRAAARVFGVVERVVPLPATLTTEAMRAAVATYIGSAAKAERELGWTVRPLEAGLRETVEVLRR
ncbi:MAG: NAD-dependent epimerase/dehydratase family protein, partial [Nocardioidaceae bacterium]